MGAAGEAGFAKLRHRMPMLSLDNAFDFNDFTEFCARARRFLGLGPDAKLRLDLTGAPKYVTLEEGR